MINYFEVLGLPFAFNLDRKLLEVSLLILQKESHPDALKSSSTSHDYSALLNTAFQTLKEPMRRAAHMLELLGYDLEDIKLELGKEFLQQTMQWRFQLADAENIEEVNMLLNHIKQQEEDAFARLALALEQKLQDAALRVYTTLKFLQRFKFEIINKLDSYEETI